MELPTGTITLIGSGEFSETMGRSYRMVLEHAPANPTAVFLDTPAGFEENADGLAAKARDYFAQRLNLTLHVASFKHRQRTSAQGMEDALHLLGRADLIVAGPGSPSYALRHWQDTPVWETVQQRFQHGAHLVLASAAAIAVGTCALPVYEIAKVGDDPYWMNGLDLFQAILGTPLAIVPHWNNTEGGTYDTRFCFMGETRFRELERQLPSGTVVLGIDEYTSCTFDLSARACHVLGAGSVTVRRDGQAQVWQSGESFSFAQLQSAPAVTNPMRLVGARNARSDAERIENEQPSDDAGDARMNPEQASLIQLFIRIRQQLRESEQYALADQIRDELLQMNILLEDTGEGTRWHSV